MLLGGRALALTLAALLGFGAAAAACGGDESPGTAPEPLLEAGTPDVGKPVATLCVDGKPVDWPPGPYEIALTSVLPKDLAFEGPTGTVKLKDYFEPCAPQSRLLVVRSARRGADHAAGMPRTRRASATTRRYAGRVLLVDLLVADEDNMPPTAAATTRWASRIDASPRRDGQGGDGCKVHVLRGAHRRRTCFPNTSSSTRAR